MCELNEISNITLRNSIISSMARDGHKPNGVNKVIRDRWIQVVSATPFKIV